MVTLLLTVRPDFAPCCPDFSTVTARFAGEYYRKVLLNRHFAPTSHRKSPTWPLNGRKSLFALFLTSQYLAEAARLGIVFLHLLSWAKLLFNSLLEFEPILETSEALFCMVCGVEVSEVIAKILRFEFLLLCRAGAGPPRRFCGPPWSSLVISFLWFCT